MREVERRFGLRAITFDDYLANPERSRRQMSHWLRGVGGASPNQAGWSFTVRRLKRERSTSSTQILT